MKNSKKLLLLSAIAVAASIQGRTENLSGRTRDLSVLQFNKYMRLQFSTSSNGSNFLRDLACNCDNPDFEFMQQTISKPFAVTEELEALSNIFDNSIVNMAAIGEYLESKVAEVEKNKNNFIDDNLRELLFSQDQDGKTPFDILEEKQATGKLGCILLKLSFEALKEELRQADKIKKAQEAEVALDHNK